MFALQIQQQQAELACHHRLQKKFLVLWKTRLVELRVEKRKTLTALYQWSLVLQRKVCYNNLAQLHCRVHVYCL